MGSFEISSARHAVTLVITHPYFWRSLYEIQFIIANLPDCQRAYPLLDEHQEPEEAVLYLASTTEMILRINQHFYLFDHASCRIFPIAPLPEKDLRHYEKEIKIGHFVSAGYGRLRFILNKKIEEST